MKTLLITPPLLQPNTPYAATPLLTAWLRAQGHPAAQVDLSLELLLQLFSRTGLTALFAELRTSAVGPELASFMDLEAGYLAVIDDVLLFLQGQASFSTQRFSLRGALPEGPHLARAWAQEQEFGWNFRGLDRADRARYLCSLFLDDIADAVSVLDPHFGFSRYAEKLSASLSSFAPLKRALEAPNTLLVNWYNKLTDKHIEHHNPQVVALTVPFPGCLFGALCIARRIKQTRPDIQIVLGGGYVNTELRELKDPGIFDLVDYITLDSGLFPLLRVIEGVAPSQQIRTFVREQGEVRFHDAPEPPPAHNELPPPTYDGLPLNRYFGLMEILNPVTSLWSTERWNKLILAHGCCWSRCSFCDTSIDYICRYDSATAATICDWIARVTAETAFNGFHFVDEALPPALLDELCDEILRRRLNIEWWGNIRFETRFTPQLVEKMARAGCLAVTGGLETCCNRTLNLMRKGITIEGAEKVLTDFSEAGVMTHAYLMYGFPTQTLEETLQALETVRRLMEQDVLHSAFWHRFALTAHSEMFCNPRRFGLQLLPEHPGGFARNEVPFDGNFHYDLQALGEGLRAAVYNYQHGAGFERPVTDWLD